jgi:hypothetical protein
MSNTILTPTAVTREALRILHQNLVFAKNVNRQYDDQFAQSGGKIGDSLKIRLPNEYTVRTGKTIQTQDTSEASVTLQVATQKGVDVNFSSKELTLDLDDFSERILKPAMARLAAEIDSDGLAEVANVYNAVGTAGTTPATALVALQAGQKLDEFLAPRDGQRKLIVNPAANAAMVDGLKGLFHSGDKLEDQYERGLMGKDVLGFDWYTSSHVDVLTTGTDHTTVTINDASIASGDTTFTTAGGNVTVGTVFTIAGVKAVHPETKSAYSYDKQFVITAVDGNDWTFSPAYITSGAKQNVDHLPSTGDAITLLGSASTAYPYNLAYHRDAFVLATADLEDVAKYGAWGSRQSFDGVSMRIARQYDINNDNVPCRIDVLYGWKTVRPELACRIIG